MTLIVPLASFLWSLSFVLAMGLLPAFALPERFAAVACGVVALALLTCVGRPWRDRVLHRPALAALVLGFLVLCVASAAYSIAPAVSVIQLGGFVMLPLTLLALMCADPDARAMFLHHAAWWCGAALVAIALWGLVQVVFFPALLTGGQPRHPFNNPNVMAALLNVGFFVALGLFVRGGHRRVMAVLWGGMLVLLVMFLSLSSKGAGITFMVGLAMAVFLFDRAQIKARGPALLALGAVAVAATIGVAWLYEARGYIDRNMVGQMGVLLLGDRATALNRIDIWAATLEMIRQNPILGAGYGTFAILYPSLRLPAEVYSGGFMAHSDPMQFWAEAGLGAVVLFYAIGIYVLVQFVRYGAGLRDGRVTGAFIAACTFAAHAHIDFPFYNMAAGMVFALVLGAVVVALPAGAGRVLSLRRVHPGFIIIPGVLFCLVYASQMAGEYLSGQGRAASMRGDMAGFERMVNGADRVALGLNVRPYILAVAIPLSLLQQSQSSMTPDEKAALKTQIETILDRARRVYPRHPAIPYNHAQTIRAIMPLDSDLALSLYLEALRLDPLYLPARTGAADLLRLTGRDDDAYKTLVAGLDWPYAAEFRILSYYKTLRAMAVERQDKAVIDTIDRLTAYHENRRLAARERAAAWRQIGGGVMDSP